MLNSAEHEILNVHKYKKYQEGQLFSEHAVFPAHKSLNADNCWHLNIYEQEKFHAQLS